VFVALATRAVAALRTGALGAPGCPDRGKPVSTCFSEEARLSRRHLGALGTGSNERLEKLLW
jgi:hypothetical protein